MQFVNPASTTFKPLSVHTSSHFVRSPLPQSPAPSQYGGRPSASPALSPTLSPALSPTPVASTYYPVPGSGQPNTYAHYNNPTTQAPPPSSSTPSAPPTPSAPTPSAPSAPLPPPAPSLKPTVKPSAAPAPSPVAVPVSKIIPHIVPTPKTRPSPEVAQKMPSQAPLANPAKKQLQRQQIQHPVERPRKPPVDYQVLLLALADEYFTAAHSRGTVIAISNNKADLEEYYKLVATGLGCLEAVLKVNLPTSCRALYAWMLLTHGWNRIGGSNRVQRLSYDSATRAFSSRKQTMISTRKHH